MGAAVGIGVLLLMLMGGRSGRRSGTAAARDALRATDEEARRSTFVEPSDPRGRVILPTEADIETTRAREPRGSGSSGLTRLPGYEVSPGRDVTERTGYDPDTARRLAGPVSRALTSDRTQRERDDVRDFQTAAGITPADGKYGAQTRAALRHFGIRTPPPAIYRGGSSTYTPPRDA